MRTILAITLALAAAACARVPVATPPTTIATPFEDKMAWILRLEDQRTLRDLAPVALPEAPPVVRRVASP